MKVVHTAIKHRYAIRLKWWHYADLPILEAETEAQAIELAEELLQSPKAKKLLTPRKEGKEEWIIKLVG